MDILSRGLSTTVIGLVVVIATLAIIAFIISLVSKALNKAESKNTSEIEETENTKSAPILTETEPSPSLTDDLELVAVISAAISAYTGISPGKFRIFDIRPSESDKWRQTNKNYN